MCGRRSTLRRLPDESWQDALLFQAFEHGALAKLIEADELIRFYMSPGMGMSPEEAADLVSHELKLPARTVEGLLP